MSTPTEYTTYLGNGIPFEHAPLAATDRLLEVAFAAYMRDITSPVGGDPQTGGDITLIGVDLNQG